MLPWAGGLIDFALGAVLLPSKLLVVRRELNSRKDHRQRERNNSDQSELRRCFQ
jgi:hypothetical protein